MKSLLKKLAVVSFGLLSCVVVKVGATPPPFKKEELFSKFDKSYKCFLENKVRAEAHQHTVDGQTMEDKIQNKKITIPEFRVTANIPEEFLKYTRFYFYEGELKDEDVLVARFMKKFGLVGTDNICFQAIVGPVHKILDESWENEGLGASTFEPEEAFRNQTPLLLLDNTGVKLVGITSPKFDFDWVRYPETVYENGQWQQAE